MVDVGIIGGTGIGERLLALDGESFAVPTSAGLLHGRLITFEGVRIFAVGRHSAGHKTPPHLVNYASIALAMRSLGVKACLSTAAVGSLRRDWPAGTLVVCSDFLDFTGRHPTLFDRPVVHRDFTSAFGPLSLLVLTEAAAANDIEVKQGGVYLCTNGPRYETPKEIEMYSSLGGNLVGMTAASEAILMREANVDYGCLAIVTNLASGISDTPLDHQEVVDEMKRSGERAVRILLTAAKRLTENR